MYTKDDLAKQKFPEANKEDLLKADEELRIFTLVTGKRNGGKPFWAYVAIPPSKFLDFKEAESKGAYDLALYGEIVKMGDEAEPPPEVVKEMQEKHGANPDFEKQVVDEINKQMKQQSKDAGLMDKIAQMKKQQDDKKN